MAIPPPPIMTGDDKADLESLYQWAAMISNYDGVVVSTTSILWADVPNANDTPGVVGLFRIDIADGASGDTDVTLGDVTIRVIDVWLIKTEGDGGVGDTIQVLNGAAAITNAMILPLDNQKVPCEEINDANHRIAAGGTLRVTLVNAGGLTPGGGAANRACTVYVLVIPVA